MNFRKKRHLTLLLFFTLFVSVTLSQAQPFKGNTGQAFDAEINYDEIIDQGIQIITKENNLKRFHTGILFEYPLLTKLENWYNYYNKIH